MANVNYSGWLRNPYVTVLTAALVIQTALFYSASRGERVPVGMPLDSFPLQIHDWHMVQDTPVEKEILDQLKADDTLNRFYAEPGSPMGLNLFIAYFKTQRTGQSPHSPKNCLPGSGWEPTSIGFLDTAIPGQAKPIKINRYVVSHGDEKSVVLYWYQSQRRVVASEYAAKFWLVMDSIRYHRSDTALVRVTVPILHNDEEAATRAGVEFVESLFPVLKGYLPA
jgi:EpsI family protein